MVIAWKKNVTLYKFHYQTKDLTNAQFSTDKVVPRSRLHRAVAAELGRTDSRTTEPKLTPSM